MKQKAFYSISVPYDIKHEWYMKEYGSYEDHGSPEFGHVVSILNHSPKTRIVCNTKDEAVILFKSALYHDGAWDDDEAINVRLMRFAHKVSGELYKILK